MFQLLSDILEPLTSCNGRRYIHYRSTCNSDVERRSKHHRMWPQREMTQVHVCVLEYDVSPGVQQQLSSPTCQTVVFPFDLRLCPFHLISESTNFVERCWKSSIHHQPASADDRLNRGLYDRNSCTSRLVGPRPLPFPLVLPLPLPVCMLGPLGLFQHTINLSFEETTSAAETVHCVSTLPHRNE